MSLPPFCYEKAFKVSMSIMLIAIMGITGIAWAQIMENTAQSIENAKELAVREAPVKKIDVTYDNVLILCEKLDASCVRYNP